MDMYFKKGEEFVYDYGKEVLMWVEGREVLSYIKIVKEHFSAAPQYYIDKYYEHLGDEINANKKVEGI